MQGKSNLNTRKPHQLKSDLWLDSDDSSDEEEGGDSTNENEEDRVEVANQAQGNVLEEVGMERQASEAQAEAQSEEASQGEQSDSESELDKTLDLTKEHEENVRMLRRARPENPKILPKKGQKISINLQHDETNPRY